MYTQIIDTYRRFTEHQWVRDIVSTLYDHIHNIDTIVRPVAINTSIYVIGTLHIWYDIVDKYKNKWLFYVYPPSFSLGKFPKTGNHELNIYTLYDGETYFKYIRIMPSTKYMSSKYDLQEYKSSVRFISVNAILPNKQVFSIDMTTSEYNYCLNGNRIDGPFIRYYLKKHYNLEFDSDTVFQLDVIDDMVTRHTFDIDNRSYIEIATDGWRYRNY